MPPDLAPNYDVCLSFAGENRDYVREVASELAKAGIQVFYDEYETVGLWGKNLYQHLSQVYRFQARYCVVFISKDYANKVWPRHELESAQARAFTENTEYILPARFDDTELPGVLPTTVYIDLRRVDSRALASLIAQKLGSQRAAASPGSAPAQPKPSPPQPPPIIRDQPKLQGVRRRLGEPLSEIDQYQETVQMLYQAGKWAFHIGVAYPDRLLDADDRLAQRLREFSTELRSVATEIDDQFESTRTRTGTLFDAYTRNPLAEVIQALRVAATNVEKLKDLRNAAKRGMLLEDLRKEPTYREAAASLNGVADEISKAQEESERSDALVSWLINMGKQRK